MLEIGLILLGSWGRLHLNFGDLDRQAENWLILRGRNHLRLFNCGGLFLVKDFLALFLLLDFRCLFLVDVFIVLDCITIVGAVLVGAIVCRLA